MRLQPQGSSSLSLPLLYAHALSFLPSSVLYYMFLGFCFFGRSSKKKKKGGGKVREGEIEQILTPSRYVKEWLSKKKGRGAVLRFFSFPPPPPLFFGCTWTRALNGGFLTLFRCVARHVREQERLREKRTKEQSDFTHIRLTQEVPLSFTSKKKKEKKIK